MKYKITVIRYDENIDYEKEMAEYKENSARDIMYQRFDERISPPEKELPSRSLEVFLTEEEYNAVKKSVLETFN